MYIKIYKKEKLLQVATAFLFVSFLNVLYDMSNRDVDSLGQFTDCEGTKGCIRASEFDPYVLLAKTRQRDMLSRSIQTLCPPVRGQNIQTKIEQREECSDSRSRSYSDRSPIEESPPRMGHRNGTWQRHCNFLLFKIPSGNCCREGQRNYRCSRRRHNIVCRPGSEDEMLSIWSKHPKSVESIGQLSDQILSDVCELLLTRLSVV